MYANTGGRIGPKDASVTIVVFSDYQCPGCLALESHLKPVREKYSDDVAVVIRHFPLEGHVFARPAARGAVCADRQERFAAYHEALFARDEEAPILRSLLGYAAQAGVPDTAAFRECLGLPDTDIAVENDIRAGRRLGVSGTPTFLVNDEMHVGVAGLETIIRRKLAEVPVSLERF